MPDLQKILIAEGTTIGEATFKPAQNDVKLMSQALHTRITTVDPQNYPSPLELGHCSGRAWGDGMVKKRHSDEDILKLLREIELHLSAGDDFVSACQQRRDLR